MRELFLLLATAALVGCASGGSPVNQLQQGAIQEVRVMAASFEYHIFSTRISEKVALEQATKALADSMKDPEGARFRGVKFTLFEGRPIVCGEINGKNSYGAYVGYRWFAANHEAAVLESAGGRYPQIDAAANAGIRAACSQ